MNTRKLLVSGVVVMLLVVGGLALGLGTRRVGRGDRGFGADGATNPGRAFDSGQMREALTGTGATEADLPAIESYTMKRHSLIEPLMQAMESLWQAAGKSATDEQAAQAASGYEELRTETLTQLAKAEEDLRAQLKLTTRPKLHAALLSMGILDNGLRGGRGMRGGRPGFPGEFRGREGGREGYLERGFEGREHPGEFGERRGGPGRPGGGWGAQASFDSRTLPNTDAEKKILAVLQELEGGRRMENVPPEDGRLLRVLTEAIGAKHVVEIGTSNGYSALWLSLALRNSGGKLITHEIDPQRVALARASFKRAGVDDIVTVVEGDAHETVTRMKEPIDLVFIDADKEGYLDYLNKLLPLVRPGGLVVAHNMNPAQADPRYVDAITKNPALETIFLHMEGTGVGVTLKKP